MASKRKGKQAVHAGGEGQLSKRPTTPDKGPASEIFCAKKDSENVLGRESCPIVVRVGNNLFVQHDGDTWKCPVAGLKPIGKDDNQGASVRCEVKLRNVKHQPFKQISVRMLCLGKREIKEPQPLLVVFPQRGERRLGELRLVIEDCCWKCSFGAALRSPISIQLYTRPGKSLPREIQSSDEKRSRGPIPTLAEPLLANLSRGLSGPGLIGDSIKRNALITLCHLMHVVIDQTLKGDSESGYFLGELMAWLGKKRERLETVNATFFRCAAKVESSRPANRSSALRLIVAELLEQARQERWIAVMAKELPEDVRQSIGIMPGEELTRLPDMSSENAKEWTDKVIYPRFAQLARDGRLPSVVMELKKAEDRHEKFQPANLKLRIQDAVARILDQPRTYYFHL